MWRSRAGEVRCGVPGTTRNSWSPLWVGEEAGRQNIRVEVALAIAFLPKSFPQGVVNHDADSNDNHKTKKY